MSMADWHLQGIEFASCNCNWGCPCQFSALPTHGNCEAVVSMRVQHGHFNDISLDDLCWVGTFAWPGAIHEGNGRCQVFIEDKASPAQREALLTILSGEETEPGATVFQVFSSTITEMYEPQFVPIEFSVDMASRQAHTRIPGVLEVTGEPIRNPVTGEPQEARLILPNGFEFTEAEMASGSYRTHGAIKISSKQSHGHFAKLHFTGQGVVR
ncbi:DUF1326 domain-containing protein [Pseudomonas cavernicola]|uniref:DUF1326 domain-containing protein n=1 Tax=Pseudomonas cavernicola TaxID=2320866 RepID=A0A418XC92_9PSED|nr:DUF1326 domain-containing protein [Pseudomonas cavernicola]RJG10119.1 DUF1326 domain-containing protein [Pseudomonas cavernicola]